MVGGMLCKSDKPSIIIVIIIKLMPRPAGGSKKSQKIQGCQLKTSGISGIFLAPLTNLYNVLN